MNLSSNSPVRWIFRICSIAFVGGLLLGLTNLDSYDPNESTAIDTVETESVETVVPIWESNWNFEYTNNKELTAQDHKDSCEFYKDYPEKSYQIYYELDSIGTRAQHDEFFNTHC